MLGCEGVLKGVVVSSFIFVLLLFPLLLSMALRRCYSMELGPSRCWNIVLVIDVEHESWNVLVT